MLYVLLPFFFFRYVTEDIQPRTVGIPQIYHFGQEGLHNILVIDLLGPSLEDMFDMCGRKFTIKTVCMAARQMVRYQPRSFGPLVASEKRVFGADLASANNTREEFDLPRHQT